MEGNNNILKAFAILTLMIYTGIFYIQVGLSLLNPKIYLWQSIGFVTLYLVFHWIAVIKADKSTGWSITLLFISLFYLASTQIYEVTFLVTITGITQFIYAVVSLIRNNISRKRVR